MQLNEMETLLIDVDQRTRDIDERVTSIDVRVTVMDERLTDMNQRLTGMDERLTAMGERVTNIDTRTSRIEQILPTFATKDDLQNSLETHWQRTLTLFEAQGEKIQLVAEHVIALHEKFDRDRR